jgi:hypothetical protein
MNRAGTLISEWVHLGEIAVILGIDGVAGWPGLARLRPFRRIACRLAMAPI